VKEELNQIFDKPMDFDLRPITKRKVKGNKRMEVVSKTKVIVKACEYMLIMVGFAHVAFSAWAMVAPDATVYRNLKGMPATDRAYIKQILANCLSTNYFADESDSCEISKSALATLFKGEAVIAQIELDRLPESKRSSYEAQAEAATVESYQGNEQGPAR
jgi:hypothetical protein